MSREIAETGALQAHECCVLCACYGLQTIRDYGPMPAADGFLTTEQLAEPERQWPLSLLFCPQCSLVQLADSPDPALLFGHDYTYLSSCSESWLAHARKSAELLLQRFELDSQSLVVEVASNDGYLLRWFRASGVPVLGIDPAPLPAAKAREQGIETREQFFTTETARSMAEEGVCASLVVANNVLAHVPDPHDFVQAVCQVLAPQGTWVIEVPHVLALLQAQAFDTVYHEHRCYFSLHALLKLLSEHGLVINDVQALSSHGGSMRIFTSRDGQSSGAVEDMLVQERKEGLLDFERFATIDAAVSHSLAHLTACLHELKSQGKRVAAYGAAAKGTILLNSLGAAAQIIEYVVDKNVLKQGRYVPGVRIPIAGLHMLEEKCPDVLLLLPWNLEREIAGQLSAYLKNGGRLLVPLPILRMIGGSDD